MTPKQERFAQEYVVDLNKTQAAIRAGYSVKTAASQGERLLRNVAVSGRVTALQASRVERVEVTQDYVLSRLVENVERAMQAIPVTVKGVPTGEYQYDGNVANAALKLLGEHLGMYKHILERTQKPYREAIDEARRDLRLVA